jgi:RNase P subunit RPR2
MGEVRRYRCSNCGNITRFDVTVSRRSRCFYHYGLDGSLNIEDEEELSKVVEEVSCRWCNTSKFVEIMEEETVSGDQGEV